MLKLHGVDICQILQAFHSCMVLGKLRLEALKNGGNSAINQKKCVFTWVLLVDDRGLELLIKTFPHQNN